MDILLNGSQVDGTKENVAHNFVHNFPTNPFKEISFSKVFLQLATACVSFPFFHCSLWLSLPNGL